MYVRMTYLNFPAKRVEESKEIYFDEVAQVIRGQKGNIDTFLLEPVEEGGDYISYSLWENESDLSAFESNISYTVVIGMIKEVVSKPPSQKYYRLSR